MNRYHKATYPQKNIQMKLITTFTVIIILRVGFWVTDTWQPAIPYQPGHGEIPLMLQGSAVPLPPNQARSVPVLHPTPPPTSQHWAPRPTPSTQRSPTVVTVLNLCPPPPFLPGGSSWRSSQRWRSFVAPASGAVPGSLLNSNDPIISVPKDWGKKWVANLTPVTDP